MQSNTVLLADAEHLEATPIHPVRLTADERFAALLGYLTGDGSIASKVDAYTKRDGSQSLYYRLGGAFYSSVKADLEEIAKDLMDLGAIKTASVCAKKSRTSGYQLQIGQGACEWFVRSGHPIGSKTTQDFRVPDWIMSGTDDVKRAYISALWGAEGTTPTGDKSSKSHLPKLPVLNMCKKAGIDGQAFFEDMCQIMADLGVRASVSVTGSDYRTYWLRVLSTPENLIAFFEKIGFSYCAAKADLAWLWSKYLRAYQAEVKRRTRNLLELADNKVPYREIAARLNMTESAVKNMVYRLRHGQTGGACGHNFPHFDGWIEPRWCPKCRTLKLKVQKKSMRPAPARVMNMLVDSHDHSYLLASGVNNFNSFETMSGRVYYSFDRNTHVGEYPFNPKLPIYIGMDFNVDPMSAIVCQEQRNGHIWVVDECVLYGSNAQETADELARRYYKYMNQIEIYPDPAGNNRNHDRGESSLDVLREAGFNRIYYKPKHPLVMDRVMAVNRVMKNAEGDSMLRVNSTCRKFIDSAEQTIFKEGTREVDKSRGSEHAMDAFGYYIDFRHPMSKTEILGVSI